MKFGKLQDISKVDFQLPPNPQNTIQCLQKLPRSTEQHFYIGCTGWSMKEWVGTVYPKGTKTKDYLRHYGKQFNTIELNTTHYRIPKEETIQKWFDQTPEDFRFCPKIPQVISHSKDLGFSNGQLPLFCETISGLREKLGCCFIQLPPYFGANRVLDLQQFLNRWPNSLPIAIEVRHESWFSTSSSLDVLQQLLAEKGASLVITDVAGRRDVLHMQLSSARTMIRFVGNALHPTDYSRIDEWVARLKDWLDKGLQEVYFFPHEPDNLLAPSLAAYLLEQIETNLKINVRGPRLKDSEEGQQMSLF